MNKKVDEENGRGGTQDNGRFRKLQWFSRNQLWKNIGCILSAPNFGLGGLRLWERDPNIIVKKKKRYLIQLKVDLYEVCASLFRILSYYYYFYTDTSFNSARCVAFITLWERSLGSIGQDNLSRSYTRRKISGGGKGC